MQQQNKKTIIIAQILISFLMALSMTGIFTFSQLGFSFDTVEQWLSRFIIAWPIAFALSIPISKLSFKLANKISNLKFNNNYELEKEV